MGKAYHVDEPLFLAPARQILRRPLHPLAFDFNWYGTMAPMTEINNTPPLMLYALAAAFALTGGGEFWMRLVFLPVDILCALALFGLASRFLSRPLLPVLIIIASPAYLINMNLLYPEKLAAAFGFCGLYALVRSFDEGRGRWYWFSAVLLGAAMLSKYGAVLFLPPALVYSLHHGVSLRRLGAYAGAALIGVAGYVAADTLTQAAALRSAWVVTSQGAHGWWANWPHKMRSILAFAGGGGIAISLWPYFFARGWRAVTATALASVIIFLPMFDLAPLVRDIDRGAGILFSCGTLLALAGLFEKKIRRARGWTLWAPWTLSVVFLEAFVYWSVLTRLIVFLIPPLVFAMAEAFEEAWDAGSLKRLYAASLCTILILSLSLARVDYRYAAAQKMIAEDISRTYPGKNIWFTGHWGFQYYMEKAGAVGLDARKGGWDQARPGDVVVTPRTNTNLIHPSGRRLANLRSVRVDDSTALRLISGWTGEGGFYSNVMGFLPYSISTEPLEEFTLVELL